MAFDYINEAFKRLDTLEEDIFKTSYEGINKLTDFVKEDDEVDETVRVIDPNANDAEALEDSYVGKVIINCNVCHSHIFENKDEITIDEDGAVNIDMQCPYCGESEGFVIIGEIAPYGDKEDIDEPEDDSVDESVTLGALGAAAATGLVGGAASALGGHVASKIVNSSYDRNSKKSIEEGLLPSLPGLSEEQEDVDESIIPDISLPGIGEETELDEGVLGTVAGGAVGGAAGNTIGKGVGSALGKGAGALAGGVTGATIGGNIGKKLGPAGKVIGTIAGAAIGSKVGSKAGEKLGKAAGGAVGTVGGAVAGGITGNKLQNKLKEDIDDEFEEGFLPDISLPGLSEDTEMEEGLIPNISLPGLGEEAEMEEGLLPSLPGLGEDVDEVEEGLIPNISLPGISEDKGENKSISMSRATKRMMSEDFKEVSIKTEDQKLEMSSDENGKVTVTTEPITSEDMMSAEAIVPVSDETEADILANNGLESSEEEPVEGEAEDFEENDMSFDEADEEGLDELGESYFKRVYENVDSFKTTAISATPTQLIVEGMIKFNSGAQKKTGFIFEAKDMNSRGQLRFVGTNKHLTEAADAFCLVGRIDNKKLFVESLKYNYSISDSAVRGLVRRK